MFATLVHWYLSVLLQVSSGIQLPDVLSTFSCSADSREWSLDCSTDALVRHWSSLMFVRIVRSLIKVLHRLPKVCCNGFVEGVDSV